MWSIVYVAIFVVLFPAAALGLRASYLASHPADASALVSPLHLLIVLYCGVNVLICVWEIALWIHQDRVISLYQGYLKKVNKGSLPSPLFLFKGVALGEALSLRYWADVWGTYSLLDVSYATPGSFGYNIDVGNGYSTLVPTLVLLVAVSDPERLASVASVRQLGFFAALSAWQALYGTLVYFFQYLHQARWRDHNTPMALRIGLVGGTNGFWIIGPAAALWACYHMVMHDSLRGLF